MCELIFIARGYMLFIGLTDRPLSTSAGRDGFLGSIEYSAHALHHLLASVLLIQPSAILLKAMGQWRHRIMLTIFNTRKGDTQSSSSSRLLSLSIVIADTRFVLRLLGLVPIVSEGISIPRSTSEHSITYALCLESSHRNILSASGEHCFSD